jgi:hypothetical protein
MKADSRNARLQASTPVAEWVYTLVIRLPSYRKHLIDGRSASSLDFLDRFHDELQKIVQRAGACRAILVLAIRTN